MPAIQFGNNGNNGNDSKFGNNAKEQPWIAKLCTENAPIDQNIRRAISCLGPPSIKATPHTLLTNNHKGDAGPKVKKRLLKNLLQKALYPRCRSKKSPKSPPKSRNNFFEFFLEQEK